MVSLDWVSEMFPAASLYSTETVLVPSAFFRVRKIVGKKSSLG